MIRDITIGQYYRADSILHQMDPRTKLVGTFVFLISLFYIDHVILYLPVTIVLAIGIRLSKVPPSFLFRGLQSILVLLVFSAGFQIFLVPGKVLWQVGFLKITQEGLTGAVYFILRLIYMVIGSSLLTLTTTPSRLTDGLEKGLGFLKIFRIPVHEIAMMMSISLRFIPILLEEADKIIKAQSSRGAEFGTGNLWHRLKSMLPLFVPLFVLAFRRADELATAMESRCYHGGEGRTKMKPLCYKRRDRIAYLCYLMYMVGMYVLKRSI